MLLYTYADTSANLKRERLFLLKHCTPSERRSNETASSESLSLKGHDPQAPHDPHEINDHFDQEHFDRIFES